MGRFQKKGTEDGNMYNIHISTVGLWDSGTLPKERDKGLECIHNILISIVGLWDSGTLPKKGTEDGNI